MKFTKERLEEIAEDGFLKHGESKELARMALAGLEAEPVAQVLSSRAGNDTSTIDKALPEGTMLYTVPQPLTTSERAELENYRNAPQVVPVELTREEYKRRFMEEDNFDDTFRGGWNACRAAIPQGAEHVSNRDELPLDYLQGHKDGLEWAALLAEANHPQTGDWLYDDPLELAKAIRKGPDMPGSDGNSPVIPDGWVACSERMPSVGEQVLAYRPDAPESNDPLIKMATYIGVSAHGHGFDCYCKPTHWMPLPAAPQRGNENDNP